MGRHDFQFVTSDAFRKLLSETMSGSLRGETVVVFELGKRKESLEYPCQSQRIGTLRPIHPKGQ